MNLAGLNALTFLLPLLIIAGLILWAALRSTSEDRMSDAWCEKHRTGEMPRG